VQFALRVIWTCKKVPNAKSCLRKQSKCIFDSDRRIELRRIRDIRFQDIDIRLYVKYCTHITLDPLSQQRAHRVVRHVGELARLDVIKELYRNSSFAVNWLHITEKWIMWSKWYHFHAVHNQSVYTYNLHRLEDVIMLSRTSISFALKNYIVLNYLDLTIVWPICMYT